MKRYRNIIGVCIAIIIFGIAAYFIWQYQTNEAFQKEGKAYAQSYLDGFTIRCGDNTYISTNSPTLFNGKILQINRLVQVEWASAIFSLSGNSVKAKDRSEGIIAKGSILILNGKSREYDVTNKVWRPWTDQNSQTLGMTLNTPIYKNDKGWSPNGGSVSDWADDINSRGGIYSSNFVPIACQDIPN